MEGFFFMLYCIVHRKDCRFGYLTHFGDPINVSVLTYDVLMHTSVSSAS